MPTGKAKERLKCLDPNCDMTFVNAGLRGKHMKSAHAKKVGRPKKLVKVEKASVLDVIERNSRELADLREDREIALKDKAEIEAELVTLNNRIATIKMVLREALQNLVEEVDPDDTTSPDDGAKAA